MGQAPKQSVLDGLEYEKLLDLFNEFDGDSIAQERIARTYQDRAKREGDTVKVARGYDRLAQAFSPQTNIKYADSLIEYTKDWRHITYPALGYILRGLGYEYVGNIKRHFEDFTKANEIAIENDNRPNQLYLLTSLSLSRIYYGSPEKALGMLEEGKSILNDKNFKHEVLKSSRKEFRSEKKINEFIAIQEMNLNIVFSACFIVLRQPDSALVYVKKNFELLKNINELNRKGELITALDSKMECLFFKSEYDNTIRYADSIQKLGGLRQYNVKNINLFKGLAYLNLGNIDNAIVYLKKSDSILQLDKINSVPFYNKLLFGGLYSAYSQKKDYKNQIKYLDNLITIDSVEMVNYKYIEPEMAKTYETPRLLEEKENVISQLKSQSRTSRLYVLVALGAGVLLLLTSLYYYRQKVVYKNRFETLVAHKNGKVSSNGESQYGFSQDLVDAIQEKLEKFESTKGFLDSSLTLNSLSKQLETNSSYLSKVLNVQKKKNFSQYLNELRIGYALQLLKENPTARKYSIEAIAADCGYNNSASFSRAFYRIAGIYPSYYIKELEKRATL